LYASWQQIQDISQTEYRVCLSQRQIAAILSQIGYLGWRTRWRDLPINVTNDNLDTFKADIVARLMEACPVDCEEIEPCIETSTTITNITNNVTNIEGDITNIETNITNIEGDITNIETNINNDVPAPPSIPADEYDELCASAVYIATKLSDIWHEIVTDAQTLTLQEFIEELFAQGDSGGRSIGALEQLWDYIVSNSNPNLVAEGETAFGEIVRYLYCDELDRETVDMDIDGSATITADAKGLWRGALSTVMDGKIAIWAYLGSLNPQPEHACLCNDFCGYFDLAIDPGDWSDVAQNTGKTEWVEGIGHVAINTGNPIGTNWRAVGMRLQFADISIRRVVFTFDYDMAYTSNPGITVQFFRVELDTVQVAGQGWLWDAPLEGDGQQFTLEVGDEICDEIEIRMIARSWTGSPPADVGYAILRSVQVICTP
jgi:hypothetical protein